MFHRLEASAVFASDRSFKVCYDRSLANTKLAFAVGSTTAAVQPNGLWNIPNPSQPNPGLRGDGSPCTARDKSKIPMITTVLLLHSGQSGYGGGSDYSSPPPSFGGPPPPPSSSGYGGGSSGAGPSQPPGPPPSMREGAGGSWNVPPPVPPNWGWGGPPPPPPPGTVIQCGRIPWLG